MGSVCGYGDGEVPRTAVWKMEGQEGRGVRTCLSLKTPGPGPLMSQGRRRRMSQLEQRGLGPSSAFCAAQAPVDGPRPTLGRGGLLSLRIHMLASSGCLLTDTPRICVPPAECPSAQSGRHVTPTSPLTPMRATQAQSYIPRETLPSWPPPLLG